VQPNPGIYLQVQSKVPGIEQTIAPLRFGFCPEEYFKVKAPDAYEKLIYDAVRGDATLFVDGEEQLAAWRFLTPVLNRWKEEPRMNISPYQAGSWGPIDHLIPHLTSIE
jgi:glucose-6-phosphate 1-dehydrogenase